MKFILIIALILSFCGCENRKTKDIFAMDTIITLDINAKNADIIISEMENEVKRLDKKFSPSNNFSNDTETNYLINTADYVSSLTDGAFNIRLSELISLWGFRDKNYKVPTDKEIKTALLKQDLDFGGIAKGYAGDRLLKIAKKHNIKSGILSLGGNVVTIGKKADGKLWKVGISDPKNPDKYIGYVLAENKSVVTSGAYQRYFEKNGKRYHHILDPKTGYPSKSGLLSVTVICEDGILSDALSTAFFVAGKDTVFKLYKELDFEAVLVTDDGGIITTDNANFHRED